MALVCIALIDIIFNRSLIYDIKAVHFRTNQGLKKWVDPTELSVYGVGRAMLRHVPPDTIRLWCHGGARYHPCKQTLV